MEFKKKIHECNHAKAIVVVLSHTAVVTPTSHWPEYFCPDCGLNLTIFVGLPDLRANCQIRGFEISEELEQRLIEWKKSILARTGEQRAHCWADHFYQNLETKMAELPKFAGSLDGLRIPDSEALKSDENIHL